MCTGHGPCKQVYQRIYYLYETKHPQTFAGVHPCFNQAESYTAGWLAHKDLVLRAKFAEANYKSPYNKSSLYGWV